MVSAIVSLHGYVSRFCRAGLFLPSPPFLVGHDLAVVLSQAGSCKRIFVWALDVSTCCGDRYSLTNGAVQEWSTKSVDRLFVTSDAHM